MGDLQGWFGQCLLHAVLLVLTRRFCLGCCLFSVVRASSIVVAVSLGILNLRIPRWSEVSYKSRIGRHVESLKA